MASQQLCVNYIEARNNVNGAAVDAMNEIIIGRIYKLYMENNRYTYFIIKVVSKASMGGSTTYDFSITGPCLTVNNNDRGITSVVYENTKTITNILSNVTSAPYDSYIVEESSFQEVNDILASAVQMITDAN